MRGKDKFPNAAFRFSGITPAYAGKSWRSPGLRDIPEDHPRLCGEKLNSAFAVLIVLGSPPPMRGKAINERETVCVPRITPAYAGKSSMIKLYTILERDHPRLCGEKVSIVSPPFFFIGSPPPMRGKD